MNTNKLKKAMEKEGAIMWFWDYIEGDCYDRITKVEKLPILKEFLKARHCKRISDKTYERMARTMINSLLDDMAEFMYQREVLRNYERRKHERNKMETKTRKPKHSS